MKLGPDQKSKKSLVQHFYNVKQLEWMVFNKVIIDESIETIEEDSVDKPCSEL